MHIYLLRHEYATLQCPQYFATRDLAFREQHQQELIRQKLLDAGAIANIGAFYITTINVVTE